MRQRLWVYHEEQTLQLHKGVEDVPNREHERLHRIEEYEKGRQEATPRVKDRIRQLRVSVIFGTNIDVTSF